MVGSICNMHLLLCSCMTWLDFVFDIFDMLKHMNHEIPLELLHSQNCLTKCLGSSLKLLKYLRLHVSLGCRLKVSLVRTL
jgi:hypothetical protein